MKPCRKQTIQRPAAVPEANVRRYVHPIRTVKPVPRNPAEETLTYILEALTRQSEQLDEVLRRLENNAGTQ